MPNQALALAQRLKRPLANADQRMILKRLRLGHTHAQIAADLGASRLGLTFHLRRPDLRPIWQRIRFNRAVRKRSLTLAKLSVCKRSLTFARLRDILKRDDFELCKAARFRYGKHQETPDSLPLWADKLARLLGTDREREMDSLALPYIPSVAYQLHGLHPKLPHSPWHRSNNAAQQSDSAELSTVSQSQVAASQG